MAKTHSSVKRGTIGMEVDDGSAKHEEYQTLVVNAAVSTVKSIEPFREYLTEVNGIAWIGYHHDARREKLSREAAEVMLRARLQDVTHNMRHALWPLIGRGLDAVRAGAMIHMAMIIGCDRLNENLKLWRAMAKQDYRSAAEALLQCEWPPATDDHAKRRVPSLMLILYTGRTAD